MPKIVIVLAVAFAVLGSASPAAAGPGVSSGGPTDRAQPPPENPKVTLSQPFEVPPGLAGTAIVSCDSRHQFSYRGNLYPYRAADPSIAGHTDIATGGPYPYTVSAESTGPVGGYHDAYYWRIHNATGRPATLIMRITCQRPAGF